MPTLWNVSHLHPKHPTASLDLPFGRVLPGESISVTVITPKVRSLIDSGVLVESDTRPAQLRTGSPVAKVGAAPRESNKTPLTEEEVTEAVTPARAQRVLALLHDATGATPPRAVGKSLALRRIYALLTDPARTPQESRKMLFDALLEVVKQDTTPVLVAPVGDPVVADASDSSPPDVQ